MNNRILLVVMTAALLTTSTGCGVFRNFLFGRGAKCGLCNRLQAPGSEDWPGSRAGGSRVQHSDLCQPLANRGCNPCGQANTCDPYLTHSDPCGVVGSGMVYGGTTVYGDNFQPRAYQSYMPAIGQGYKVDNDGARIIHEEPLPPGAMAVQ